MDHQLVAKGGPIVITSDHFLLLSYNQKLTELSLDSVLLDYARTGVYWLEWSANTRRFARFNEEIVRSALALKLLSFQKTGAMLAAVTTSLPEEIGAVRNWDYRFCWLRDASMNIAVLTKLGHYKVAKNFMDFILDVIPYKDEKIRIVYGINGQKKLHEKIPGHLALIDTAIALSGEDITKEM